MTAHRIASIAATAVLMAGGTAATAAVAGHFGSGQSAVTVQADPGASPSPSVSTDDVTWGG